MAGENTQRQFKAGTDSTMAPQLNEFFQRKSMMEEAKKEHFGQLADMITMPKNMGKKIKQYVWIPLLDDANINDQGINAAGIVTVNGNLYGSSKDIGTIEGKLPTLSETGGRVNRVGFKRRVIEGTFQAFGFFDEYTQESVDFDSEPELLQHVNREMLRGAHEIQEDKLGIDLILNAGTVRFAGNATSNATVGGDDVVTYRDLMNLNIILDNNRTPKKTTIVAGTRNVDTRVIPAARIMFVGSELLPTLYAMVDLHGDPAFIPVEKYAAGTTLMNDEAGSVGHFRIVVVPEMVKWAGAGVDDVAGLTYETGNKVDVFPMLVVGDESFTTIGFKTGGAGAKFTIYHKKPGEGSADRTDPYGKTGFMSIQWYYGFMALRPERIAVIKTAAKL